MVQRKDSNKLGIQNERVKTERLSINLKPSLQDVKNGGTDVKKNKKMKKSGSIKHPEIKTPNYMKATTSSDARKEKSQASTKTPQTSPHTSSFRRKSPNSESSNTKAKTFARTTSLKLTSTPSFKVSAKKCSPVALCENLDVQRATCSSTLKDCKFPTYLTLSPGGTELEGTSAMKVCPYTYCSLNGHKHAPLPPLKLFLSAKRRMIKTQRSIKLGCLSPRRAKPANQMQEDNNDFFVEIFALNEENNETQAKSCKKEVAEMVADGKNRDEIDTRQFLDQNGEEKEAEMGFLSEIDSDASEMDLEIGNESSVYLDDDYEEPFRTEKEPDPEEGDYENCDVNDDFFIKLDENIKNCFNEVLENEASQESFDEQSSWSSSDEESINDSNDYVKIEEEILDTVINDDVAHQASADDENHSFDESQTCNTEKQDEIKKESNQDGKIKEAKEPHSTEQEMEDNSLTKFTTKSHKPIQDSDESGPFNLRGPNFLPMEPELEGENVDLRHQELDERKNAEEWMVDFALRRVVTKLGVERKRKVALLVEAFEKVIPLTKCEINQAYSSTFDSPRPIQACN